jgi:hypothetical protein
MYTNGRQGRVSTIQTENRSQATGAHTERMIPLALNFSPSTIYESEKGMRKKFQKQNDAKSSLAPRKKALNT